MAINSRRYSGRHFLKFGLLVVGGALVLSACSSSSSTPAKPKPSTSYSSSTTSSSSTSPSQTKTGSVVIKTAHSAIGTVLVNGSGMVLYTLTSATSTSSPCDTSKCLSIWPPVSGSSKPSASGLSSAYFGTLTLPSGAEQLTYYGHPLYLFSGDSAAGQTNGEGLAFPVGSPHPTAHWYALSSSGSLVVKSSSSVSTATKSSSSPSTGASTGSSSGYGASTGTGSSGSSSSGYGSSTGTGSSSSGYGSNTGTGSPSGYSSSTGSGSTSSKQTSSSSSGGWNG